jgi:xanthine dehydrogenase YagS FAD-binding subunit
MSTTQRPLTLTDAAASIGEFRSGGSDVQERRRSGRSAGDLVDLTGIGGLSDITVLGDGGVHIGALVTVHRVATDSLLAGYPALQKTAGALATPQIRRQATIGGNLVQQTRCTYFRNEHFECLRTGGEGCPARDGWHAMHVVFDNGGCIAPHASSMAVALLTYDALVNVHQGHDRTVGALYGDLRDPTKDHDLPPGEIITGVTLAPPTPHERAHYLRAISRAAAEWPLVEAAARLVVDNGTIAMARVAVGGVARMPMRLDHVEHALVGQPASENTLAFAADQAVVGANALVGTSYKVPLLRNVALDALQHCLS